MKNSINIIRLTLIFVLFFVSCKKEQNNSQIKLVNPNIKLEKIIVINLNEVCVTYFKVKLENKNNNTFILLDNSLKEYHLKRLNPQKTGFYLKNIKNDSLITLGIDNYHFYEVDAKKSGFCFIGAVNFKKSFEERDSLLLRKLISNYILEYNGKKLDLNKIEKTNYISQNAFDEFIKRKNNFIPFKDSLTIPIPKNIKIKYLNYMPVSEEEWNNL